MQASRGPVNLSEILFITSRHVSKSHSAEFTNYGIHSMLGTWLLAWVNPAGEDKSLSSAPVQLGNQIRTNVSSSASLSVKWGCRQLDQ